VSSSLTDTGLVDVTMPQMGVSVAEGTIVAWRIGLGEAIEAEQTIVEISTDKIDSEVPSPVSGVLAEILVEPDQTVDVGTVLGRIATDDGAVAPGPSAPAPAAATSPPAPAVPAAPAAPAAPEASSEPAPARPAAARSDGRHYSPVVQRIAAEHGIELASVTGTGRGGRVRKQDVLALVSGNGSASPPAPASAPEPPMHIESPYRPDPDVPSRPRAPRSASG
jgi:2-oxoglutarate dehydrogenase E2 component (dihydrolipoamide succinyltransferase)